MTSNERIYPLRSLLIFVVVVFLGGALLAPWLYQLVQALAPSSNFAAGLAHQPFRRYVDRCFLGLALLGIWPLLRSLGARSAADFGLVKPAGQWRRLGTGFALGFGSLAGAACIVLVCHGRALNETMTVSQLLRKLLGPALAAIVVPVLEEILFRGAIFGSLRRGWNWRLALLLSSMIYAIVHFMGPADLPGPVTWSSGLELLPRKLGGFADWNVVIPGFFNLTFVGIMLGLAYQRTGNLYFSIGLHSGWIFWGKSYGILTVPVANPNPGLFGTDKLIDGWLALGVLTAALLLMLRLLPARAKSAPP